MPDVDSDSELVRSQYQRVLDAAHAAGRGPEPSETPQESERRFASLIDPFANEALQRLTVAYEHLRYGGVLDEESVQRTRRDADAVVAAIRNLPPPIPVESHRNGGVSTAEQPMSEAEHPGQLLIPAEAGLAPSVDADVRAGGARPTRSSRGTLRIVRRHATALSFFRSWNVLVDGQRISKVRDGQTIELDVSSGPHQVSIKSGRSVTQVLQIEVEPGATRSIECGPDGSVKMKALNYTGRVTSPEPPSERLSFIEAHVLD